MRLLRFPLKSWSAADGNAVLGFIAVAPLIGLLLVSVIEMSAIVWTREVVAELLRQEVANSARIGGSIASSRLSLSRRLAEQGIETRSSRWTQESLGGGELLLSATLEVRPRGIALLPSLTTTVSSTAVVEHP